MWLLRYLIEYSLSSLLLGLLTALVCGVLSVLLAKALRPGASVQPVGLVMGGMLLAGVAVQAVLFFGALRVESTLSDAEEQIARASEVSEQVADVRLPELPPDMAGDAHAALSSYRWRRLGWGLSFIALGTAVLALTARKKATAGYYGDDATALTTDYGFDSSAYSYDD